MNYYDNQRDITESLRKMYPKGTRVECINMEDPYSPVPPGTRGTVKHVDDMATVHVSWDSGSSLGLVYGEDSFRKLTQEEIEAESQSEDAPTEDSEMTMNM